MSLLSSSVDITSYIIFRDSVGFASWFNFVRKVVLGRSACLGRVGSFIEPIGLANFVDSASLVKEHFTSFLARVC